MLPEGPEDLEPAESGHPKVGYDKVHRRRIVPDQRERGFAIPRLENRTPVSLEHPPDGLPSGRFIIRDDDSCRQNHARTRR